MRRNRIVHSNTIQAWDTATGAPVTIFEYRVMLDTTDGPFRSETPGIKSYRTSFGIELSWAGDGVFEDVVTGRTFATRDKLVHS